MATPHEYFQNVINKKFDEDGVPKGQPYQCVDGFKHFCRTVVGYNVSSKSICNPSGYAYSIWDNYESMGFNNYFDKVPSNQMVDGDWAIWAKGSNSCPQGHVAMFRKDNGNGTGIFLGQNQSNHPEYTQQNLYYDGCRGAFRPKCYHQATTSSSTEKVDQILHKGSKVQLEGTYEVKDINVQENTALITIEGKDYWISSTPLKEV